jgi:isochorismate synthase
MTPRWHGYPGSLLIIPRVLVSRIGGDSHITLAFVIEPDGRSIVDLERFIGPDGAYHAILARLTRRGATGNEAGGTSRGPVGARYAARSTVADRVRTVEEFPPAGTWKAAVRETAGAVRDGLLHKAVLARGLRIQGRDFDPAAALHALRAEYPGCTLFAVARGKRCFLGATPERLVRLRNGEVTLAAVAGSAPRGRTEEEDRRLGERLLASPKDGIEHAIVVDAVRQALMDVSVDVAAEPSPRLLSMRNAHHLYTPIRATLRDRPTVLALADRLHPTPAVGGVPRAEAVVWIRRHEGWDRGWYAGPIGWMDHTGEGEAAVAIRSALVGATEAFLFAGCGIVADSDPEQEYAESRLKLQPVLSALGGAMGENAY